MGYRISHNIRAIANSDGSDWGSRLQEISGEEFDSNDEVFGIEIYSGWRDCYNDMLTLSREFPTVLFELDCLDDESSRWRTRFLNGQSHTISPVWPDFPEDFAI